MITTKATSRDQAVATDIVKMYAQSLEALGKALQDFFTSEEVKGVQEILKSKNPGKWQSKQRALMRGDHTGLYMIELDTNLQSVKIQLWGHFATVSINRVGTSFYMARTTEGGWQKLIARRNIEELSLDQVQEQFSEIVDQLREDGRLTKVKKDVRSYDDDFLDGI